MKGLLKKTTELRRDEPPGGTTWRKTPNGYVGQGRGMERWNEEHQGHDPGSRDPSKIILLETIDNG
jgi:hypothetical protein